MRYRVKTFVIFGLRRSTCVPCSIGCLGKHSCMSFPFPIATQYRSNEIATVLLHERVQWRSLKVLLHERFQWRPLKVLLHERFHWRPLKVLLTRTVSLKATQSIERFQWRPLTVLLYTNCFSEGYSKYCYTRTVSVKATHSKFAHLSEIMKLWVHNFLHLSSWIKYLLCIRVKRSFIYFLSIISFHMSYISFLILLNLWSYAVHNSFDLLSIYYCTAYKLSCFF